MSAPPKRFVRYIKRMGAGSMLISIIVHVAVIIFATIWVVSSVHTQRKALFKAGDDAGSTVQHPVKMSNTQPHLDTLTKRLSVDTPDAAVALPDLPSLDSGLASPSLDTKLGTAGGAGGLKGPIMPMFGFREPPLSGALVGTLYLLPSSQYKNNQQEQDAFKAWMKKYASSGWPESSLTSLKKSPATLYNTQIVIPKVIALEAPKAFGVPAQESKVRFLIHYHAKIVPPHPGTWRFVGYGDDIMIVKVDGRVVLESSGPWEKLKHPGLTGWTPQKAYAYTPKKEDTYTVGDWMQLTNWPVNIEIYLSEEPSVGNTSAVLLAEEEGVSYAKTANKLPVLPIWTLAPNPRVNGGKLTIPVAAEAPVWHTRN